jgi:hypothetical protein
MREPWKRVELAGSEKNEGELKETEIRNLGFREESIVARK